MLKLWISPAGHRHFCCMPVQLETSLLCSTLTALHRTIYNVAQGSKAGRMQPSVCQAPLQMHCPACSTEPYRLGPALLQTLPLASPQLLPVRPSTQTLMHSQHPPRARRLMQTLAPTLPLARTLASQTLHRGRTLGQTRFPVSPTHPPPEPLHLGVHPPNPCSRVKLPCPGREPPPQLPKPPCNPQRGACRWDLGAI